MATSWLEIDPESDFSLDNLPFGIAATPISRSFPHTVVAIGSFVLDLHELFYASTYAKSSGSRMDEIFPCLINEKKMVFGVPYLNFFAQLGREAHREVRAGLQALLRIDTPYPDVLRDNTELRNVVIFPQSAVRMHRPMKIGDYTDFYAGYHHAYAVGKMFRGAANALQPNYHHLPVGYHGRASTVISSPSIRRPVGQILLDKEPEPRQPVVAPTRKLDFELELGCFITKISQMPGRIDISNAEKYIFGYVLLNDWSARDIQTWEYVPLGPFNGKNFATTVSPWVVLADALEPFRCKGIPNPTPLQGYLREKREDNVFDIKLEVDLTTSEGVTTTICRTSSKNLMWSFPQMIAHHTLGGCAVNPGDLLGSGTISGTGPGECGSLLEMSQGGKVEVPLNGTGTRTFLKNGDTVTMRGSCQKSDGGRVGFGECTGKIYETMPDQYSPEFDHIYRKGRDMS